MKAKLFLGAAMIAAASVAWASDSVNVKFAVVERQNGIFKVIYEGQKPETVQLNVLDENGKVIFSRRIRKANGFMVPVNFSGMEHGTYTIQVSGTSGKYAKSIVYGKTREEAGKPVIHVTRLNEQGKYLLSLVADEASRVSIAILDEANNTVYRESRYGNSLGIVYNLKDVNGTPTFRIKTESGMNVTVRK